MALTAIRRFAIFSEQTGRQEGRRRVKFYQVMGCTAGLVDVCFTDKGRALEAARDMAARTGRAIPVDRVEVGGDRSTILALLNGDGWCKRRETAFTVHAARREHGADQ